MPPEGALVLIPALRQRRVRGLVSSSRVVIDQVVPTSRMGRWATSLLGGVPWYAHWAAPADGIIAAGLASGVGPTPQPLLPGAPAEHRVRSLGSGSPKLLPTAQALRRAATLSS